MRPDNQGFFCLRVVGFLGYYFTAENAGDADVLNRGLHGFTQIGFVCLVYLG